jgi:hypothetical protein
MNTTSRALLLMMIFSGSVNMQAARTTTLIDNSPFLPFAHQSQTEQNKVNQPTPKTPPSFILRGICKIGTQFQFSIHDIRTQKSKWIQAGEATNGFMVISYDPITKSIEYKWNNERNTLKLYNSDDQPIPLTFLKTSHSTEAQSTVHPNNNTTQHSRGGKISNNVQSELDSRQSLEKIFFNKTTSIASNGGAQNNYYTSSNGQLFATAELPAEYTNQIPNNGPETPTRRFSIKRDNQVENPNGTTPDHER